MLAIIAFFAGVCAAWGELHVPWQLAAALLCLCGLAAFQFPFLRLLWLFVAGACYCSIRVAISLAAVMPAGDHEMVGVVVGIPSARVGRTVFEFDAADGPAVRLSWYGAAPELAPGQRWRLTVRLRNMHGSRNEGGRDYEGYLLRSGISGVGYVRDGEPLGLSWNVDRLRHAVGSAFSAAAAGDMLPLLRALGIGDRSLMSSAHREVLARTGTAHLMAISGLHVGMVAGMAGLVAGMLWWLFPSQRFPAPRCAMAAGVALAFAYSMLAGFTLPTQRALLMLCFYVGALWLGRNVAWSVLLLRALLCVLLFDPLAPAAADFWLSFGAVAVITLALSARLQAGDRPSAWLPRLLSFLCGRGWLATQWAVSLGTLPLLLFWFGSSSLVSLPANIVAIPVVSLALLPLVLAAVALSPWPSLAAMPLAAGDAVMGWLWRYLEHLAALPWAALSLPPPDWTSMLLCCCGVLLLLLPRGVAPRIGGLACLLALWLPPSADMAPGEAHVVMLDVGQGSAAVILTQNKTVVVDTGAASADGWSAARSVIAPFLRGRGRRHIDMLVLSHGDNDHSGGAAELMRLLPVREVVAGAAMPGFDPCRRGRGWRWDGVDFSFLHPPDGSWHGNDGSCVLRVVASGRAALFPGDIEGAGEGALLEAAPGLLRADVLAVPHHGSRTSSTQEFVRTVRPLYALVSAGCANRFGFPKQDIMGRYRSLGAVMLSTAMEGMVEIRIASDGSMAHGTWRERGHRVWHGWACGAGG